MSTFRKFDLNQEPVALEYIRSGIKGLDQLFGGGLPYNNLILIEEDEFSIYVNLLLKSISSNAVHEDLKLTYFSDSMPKDVPSFVQKLPARCRPDSKPFDGSKDMQIAFRYNHIPSLEMEAGFLYDFGRLIDERMIKNLSIDKVNIYSMDSLSSVMEDLVFKLTHLQNSYGMRDGPQHLIIIDHLSATCPNLTSDNICAFIYQLKSFVRQLNKCAIVVSLQSGWLPISTTKRLRNISDSTIQLESFDTMKRSVYSDDYKGALHVHKVTRVSSAKDSLVANLGFQLRKNNRHFVIEKLYLPPDISDTASRSTASVPNKASSASEDIF